MLPLLSGSQSAIIREGTSILPEKSTKAANVRTYLDLQNLKLGGLIWVSTNPPGTSQVMLAPICETETIRDD